MSIVKTRVYTANAKRVKNSIADVFIEVLKDKSFDKISVSYFLERAEINRSSFYRYFQDKYDMAVFCLERVMQGYINIVEKNNSKAPTILFSALFDYLNEHKKPLWRLLQIENSELNIFGLIIDYFRKIKLQDKSNPNFIANIKSFYFADIHYVPLYLYLQALSDEKNEELKFFDGKKYADAIINSVIETTAELFHIAPTSLSDFLRTKK